MANMDLDDHRLSELRDPKGRIAAAARRLTPLDADLEQPPPDLWNRIADDIGMARDENLAEVVPLHSKRRGVLPLLAAAAVLVVVAVGLGTLLSSGEDGGGDTSVVASTELEPLGDLGTGTAQLLDTGDGELALAVDFSGVASSGGFLEVWLLDPDVSQLVSLGPARADGVYQVPAGLDPSTVPVVDVSFEVFDGDPSHGGNSVLRGVLDI